MSKKLVAAGIGVVALGIVGLSSVFVVQEQEQAIVLQLGAFVRVEQRPGLHFKLPFVQDVRYFDKRVLDFEADLGEINTADQKQTLVDTYSRYRITDPLRFLQTAGSIEAFEARREDAPFNAIIKSTVREVFARADLATLLTAASAVLLGISEGGPLCTLFAATYPEKTEALIAIGSYARRLKDPEYPWGQTRAQRDAFCQVILEDWGGPVGLDERAPSRANDPDFRDWWSSYLRMGASPGAAVALTQMNAEIDVRDVLPSIQVPTLVLHRTGDRCLRVEEGRYLASRIPTSQFVELPGDDHLPFVGNQDEILAEIARFLSETPERPVVDKVLATVLTVRANVQASDREHLRRVFAREVAACRGRPLRTDDTHFVAIFDGPDTGASTGSRPTSTTTLQALYFLNDPFVHDQAERLAARLLAERSNDDQRIELAYALCFGRLPTDDERLLGVQYLTQRESTADAWTSYVRGLLRTNEFVYVD